MRSISLSILIASVFVARPAAAQQSPDHPMAPNAVGKWDMHYETPRGAVTQQLVLELDAEHRLTGTLEGPRGTTPLQEVSLEGNRIRFTLERGRGDRTFRMQFTGTIDGDDITGTFTGARGGEVPWTAKRKAAD